MDEQPNHGCSRETDFEQFGHEVQTGFDACLGIK